jgi:hypothetical protein
MLGRSRRAYPATPAAASLHLRVFVEIEVLADLVEDGGNDLLLDRLRVGRVVVLVRTPRAIRDALLDSSTENGIGADFRPTAHRSLSLHRLASAGLIDQAMGLPEARLDLDGPARRLRGGARNVP